MNNEVKKQLKIEVGIQDTGLRPPLDGGGHMSSGAGLVKKAVEQLTYVDVDALVASISVIIDDLAEAFRPKPGGADSCEVKFGLKVGGTGDIILAKMNAEVNLEVKLTWKREEHSV